VTAAPDTDPALRADWLAVCRAACAGVDAVLDAHPLTADRETTTGRGEGGDLALVIDRRAEDAIFAELDALGHGLTAISEERGEVAIAGGGPTRVVIDPIDGSLNAKRRVPMHAVSIAVASGPSMADVEFGYVRELGAAREEWWARRGEGAWLGDERLGPLVADASIELLGIESANPRVVAPNAERLEATGARRLRALGAIAISLAYVAGARFDAMLSLAPCRSVDAAAAQLVVREAGGAVAFPDAAESLAGVGLDLGMRSRVLAAASPEALDALLATFAPEAPVRPARPGL
jgi:myo-inositol-1(or 4)-monophosphatase